MFSKFKLFLQLFNKAFGAYKSHIFLLTALGFLGGLLGGIGINVLIPIFSFLADPSAEVADPISKFIRAGFLALGIDFSLKFLLIFIVILFVLKAIILVIFSLITVRIIAGYEEKTRSNLFRTVFNSNWGHLLKQRLGHLQTILITNIEYSQNVFSQISGVIMTSTNLVIYTLIAITISWKITLITFGLGGFLFLFLKPLIRNLREMAHAQDKINRDVAHHINENVLGIKAIKAFSVSEIVSNGAEVFFKKWKRLKIRANIFNNLTSIFIEPLSVVFIAFVFAVSYKTSGFNFASLIAVVYLIKQIFIFLSQFQTFIIGLNTTTPYLRTLVEYEELAVKEQENESGVKKFLFQKELAFQDVYFSYESGTKVLNSVSFEIKKGEMVGIIGPSGAGKTTLVDLMLRLFTPGSGKILVDGASLQDINLKDWRKNVGYVSQEIFLINDSIKNNIKFYDDGVTDADIERAAKMADIYDFVMTLPEGFNTSVGERGVLLSGGQKQRISIARALVRNPSILILDEATSALDNESEIKIQDVIHKLKGKLTIVVIAHRLSTIETSDKIIALNNGKVEKTGTPAELLKNKESYFYKVYNIRK
ncbi:MAG: ABC transporter ATP-binding protein [Patescibacteria group bacterium]